MKSPWETRRTDSAGHYLQMRRLLRTAPTRSPSAPDAAPPLFAALSNPACYPHPVSGVRVLETHISWILLTGEYAYKIKKPVYLGFLDFSTLGLRRHYCEEELRLNRRLAPELYLELVEIRGAPRAPRVEIGRASCRERVSDTV